MDTLVRDFKRLIVGRDGYARVLHDDSETPQHVTAGTGAGTAGSRSTRTSGGVVMNDGVAVQKESAMHLGNAMPCGVLLVNEYQEVFLARVNGNGHWDVPTRIAGPDESPLAAALSEARAASGLELGGFTFEDLGVLEGPSGRARHLFAAKLPKASLDPAACICMNNYLDNGTGRITPEVEDFAWVEVRELARHCSQSLRRVLETLLVGGLAERLPMQAPQGANSYGLRSA